MAPFSLLSFYQTHTHLPIYLFTLSSAETASLSPFTLYSLPFSSTYFHSLSKPFNLFTFILFLVLPLSFFPLLSPLPSLVSSLTSVCSPSFYLLCTSLIPLHFLSHSFYLLSLFSPFSILSLRSLFSLISPFSVLSLLSLISPLSVLHVCSS